MSAAQEAGLERTAGPDAVDDGLVGAVVAAVRPERPTGHGTAWAALLAHEEQIRAWVSGEGAKPLSIVKIEELLARLSTGWLDYAQHAGFVTDPARVR